LSSAVKVKLKPGISQATLQAMRAYLDVFSSSPHAIKFVGDSIEIELAGPREVTLIEEQFPEFIEKEAEHSQR